MTGTKPTGLHLCRPPLMRGLLGPKGLYMLARPLLLGLHSCIVPGDAEGGVTVTPSQASPDSPSPAYPFV